MKKVILLFTICLAIFLVNLILLHSGRELPGFLVYYLNDLLCLPIVLSICFFTIRSFSKNKTLKISLFSAFSLAGLYAVYFEIYLPEVTERYTADVMDAILYFLGALIFWLVQRSQVKTTLNKKAAHN